jgi:TonB family protein
MLLRIFALYLFAFLPAVAFAQDQPSSQTPPGSSPQQQDSTKRLRVGGNVMQANLIKMVQPIYPQIAKTAHISGTVVLHAVVGTDGKVLDLQYVSGPPLLMKAAMDAVHQWEYKPMLLNGEPVQVDTTISVVFSLGDNTPSSQKPPEPPVDPQFRSDILRLLEVIDYKNVSEKAVREAFVPLRPRVRESFPDTPNRDRILDSYVDKLAGLMSSPDGIDRVVAIYAKHLSDDDIKGLIAFYQTPAGQHFGAVEIEMSTELGEMGRELAADHIGEIFTELCKEYPELEGKVNFCPANQQNTSQLEGLRATSKPDGQR